MPAHPPGLAPRAVADAYDRVAGLYADLFADMLRHQPVERAMIAVFAELVRVRAAAAAGRAPRAVDVGCGPGQITAHLHHLGVPTIGLDLAPAMLTRARRDHPGLPCVLAAAGRLPLADGSLGGLLAWYSLIHLPPVALGPVLAEFHRVLAPGAPLLLATQATETEQGGGPHPHPHRVAPAWRWSPGQLADAAHRGGFTEIARLRRAPGDGDPMPASVLLCTREAHQPTMRTCG